MSTSASVAAQPQGPSEPDAPTTTLPAAAGMAPDAPPAVTAASEPVGDAPPAFSRSRARRRARHLRRIRELAIRDLGGYVYEVRRHGGDDRDRHAPVLEAKLGKLERIDAELAQLGGRASVVLREPGIGGQCPACGEPFGSDARFCSACGTDVRAEGAPAPEAAPVVTASGAAPVATTPGEAHP